MRKAVACLTAILTGFIFSGYTQPVHIEYPRASPQAGYAARCIESALEKRGYSLNVLQAGFLIAISIDSEKLEAEAYSVVADGNKILVKGGDERGMIYGSLSVAEDVRNGIRLQHIQSKSEHPH